MSPNRLIVIEGPIGVGKTTLAQLLAQEMGADLVLEKVEENPFLPLFYQNPEKWAFQTQISFLFSRARQMETLLQQSLYTDMTITDYFFPRDRIFAYMNLKEEELVLYEQIYKLLNPNVPKPDLVVFLQADTDTLFDRIRQRGRPYEKEIRPLYLRNLNEAYNRFFFLYDESPLLIVQASDITLLQRPDDLAHLVAQIKQLKRGKEYYHPGR
ncbi:MAG: deoxynucleoside kinase [Candidatus Manganitrophaceae bacterium]